MDVFREYKPLRNKIAHLALEDALGVIWAYCQYLQIDDFSFPREIEVLNSFLNDDVPQRFIAEWELELLAKEVILNGNIVASKDRTLRSWKTMSEIVNGIKDLENRIYGHFGSSEKMLIELIRIAHRQFIWQASAPNSATTIRYFKIFNRPGIDEICIGKTGLSIWKTYMCATACMGCFLGRPAIAIPFRNEIKALSTEDFDKFFAFTSKPIAELKTKLKAEQQYTSDFAYAFNSLRAYPLVRMSYQGVDSYVCPLMTLLFWKFTGGLYYEFMGVPKFANEFGDGFHEYVGEVIEQTCFAPIQRWGEKSYAIGKLEKRTVDWIVADENSALFLECKAKRISWGAKASLSDLAPLEADIDSMASAVVQVYKTLADHLNNYYPHLSVKEGRKIFPVVVTLENWRLFGAVMMDKLAEAVASKLCVAGLTSDLVEKMPYSVFAVEELEVGLQIMNTNGIDGFMEGKLKSLEMRNWDWHGYMTNRYPKSFPAKRLFQDEYDAMFSELFLAQNAGA